MSENMRKCCGTWTDESHGFGCVEQESGERYVAEIRANDLLADVVDTLTERRVAVGIHPLLAIRRAATLNGRHEGGMSDPTEEPLTSKRSRPALFLDKLTAYARQQRLAVLLAEVRGAEDEALSQMTSALVELNRAIALRERLEHMLERPVCPLSATESAEPVSVMGQGTPDAGLERKADR
ncbi:MAG TPA: hypothetical protein VI653_15830 [Steroidobacteraceae bacterium]